MIWTAEMDAWFSERAPYRTWRELSEAFAERFGVPLTKSQVSNRKAKLGIRSLVPNAGCFKKGNVSHNKGKKVHEFMSPEGLERSKRGRFKKGGVPHNAAGKGIGYERVTKEGYVQVKMKDGPQRNANDNFRFKHHLVWEEANGMPVPEGCMVVFADHDKRNFDPDNLVLVRRSEWAVISAKRRGYSDRETLEARMAVARLESAAYRASMAEKRACRECGAEFGPEFKNQTRCRACIDARRGRRRKDRGDEEEPSRGAAR